MSDAQPREGSDANSASGSDADGPYKAGDLVAFSGHRFMSGRSYAAHIDQATADRLNRAWRARQAQQGK